SETFAAGDRFPRALPLYTPLSAFSGFFRVLQDWKPRMRRESISLATDFSPGPQPDRSALRKKAHRQSPGCFATAQRVALHQPPGKETARNPALKQAASAQTR